MLVLRLLLMILSIICLMDGHAEVLSSTTAMRNGGENLNVKPNKPEIITLDRKKKKPKKNNKKKKKDKRPKKPNPPKPVTTTPKMTTISAVPVTTTETRTTTTIPTTMAKETEKTSLPASTTTTIPSTSTITTPTTTTHDITTTSSVPTTTATTATTADSGGGECKATNGKSCILPFKDGNEEYSECKNHGGKYFWCATAVYDSGKYKHWSYCPIDGSCPLEGEGECKATNNMPCVFPFKDGEKVYNECVDFNGNYFWCATGTNSDGKYTTWSKCPKDGSCPLPGKTTIPSSSTTKITTESPDSSATATAIANVENTLNEINETLQTLATAGFTEDEKQLLEAMTDLDEYFNSDSLTRSLYDPLKINDWTQKMYSSTESIKATNKISPGFYNSYQAKQTACSNSAQTAKLSEVNAGNGRMFLLSTIIKTGTVRDVKLSSTCCSACKGIAPDSQLFEYFKNYKQCECYKTRQGHVPKTTYSYTIDSGVCVSSKCAEATKNDCPSGHVFVKGGFSKIPDDSRLLNVNTENVKTVCECRQLCDERMVNNDEKNLCLAFLFNTCYESKQPRCMLLNTNKPDTKGPDDQYIKHYAFCKREGAYNLQSNGGANTMYPKLMGVYKLSEEIQNNFPVYKQMGGSGVAYVEPTGNWAVVENKYVSSGQAHMYSIKRPILDTPPPSQWYYNDGKTWMIDLTLTMVSTKLDMKNINLRGKNAEGCAIQRQYRCYAFNHGDGTKWHHRYMYHTDLHLPLFSIARFTHDLSSRKFQRTPTFTIDDNSARRYRWCGGTTASDDSRIPSQAEYLKQDEDRGHLVASEMFNTFFPGTFFNVRSAAMFMSNIFPQNPKCNRGGAWRKLEKEVIQVALKCVKKKAQFYLFHGLMPSDSVLFGQNTAIMPIQWVDAIFTSYCCLSSNPSEIVTKALIITNPQNNYNIKCEEEIDITADPFTKYAAFLTKLKHSIDPRVKSNLVNGEEVPFVIHPTYPQCVTDFKPAYSFPQGDHING